MSIDILPTETLVQILDDASLEIGDLAVISRVSRRWHAAVIPALYGRFTFRYSSSPKPKDLEKLESFKKYSHHVKHLGLHIKDWGDSDDDSSESDRLLAIYLRVLGHFREVTHVEHYDTTVSSLTWPVFWTIVNYLVSEKRKLISLTIRRNPGGFINPSMDRDVNPETLLPTPCLPNLTSLDIQVNNKRSNHDSVEPFPSFFNNLVLALGESCRNVSKLQIYLKWQEPMSPEKRKELQEVELPRLPVGNIKRLRYVMWPDRVPPSHLLDTEFEDTKTLTAPSWVCGDWLNSAWEELPSGQSLNYFQNLETLRITDSLQMAKGNSLEQSLSNVTKHLPKLESLILDEYGKQFSISRKPDGSPIWEEIRFVV
ncbi:hypothetical protein TWF718_001980 [Orbilia javanica]|uniref:F-box domain-containing protein n=1 Tax=Orbilia javanica TaxID=47235 RepID=A0AAN8RNR3_9PEZI